MFYFLKFACESENLWGFFVFCFPISFAFPGPLPEATVSPVFSAWPPISRALAYFACGLMGQRPPDVSGWGGMCSAGSGQRGRSLDL